MFDKEVLDLFCEQMNFKSVYDKKFLEKLVTLLRQNKYFERLNNIELKKTNLFIEADTIDNEITLYPENINASYNNIKREYGITSDTLFTRNICKSITLIHELTHVYQHNLEMNEIKEVCLECMKIKDGYVLMNGKIDELVIDLLNKMNLSTFSELYVTLKSCKLYYKNHDMFPTEKMAEGYAFKYLVSIYHLLGKEYFKDFESFLDAIVYHITKDYYQDCGIISTPYNRFIVLVKKYGYTFKDIDIQKISEYDRLLIGMEEDKNTIDRVINTKILRK